MHERSRSFVHTVVLASGWILFCATVAVINRIIRLNTNIGPWTPTYRTIAKSRAFVPQTHNSGASRRLCSRSVLQCLRAWLEYVRMHRVWPSLFEFCEWHLMCSVLGS
jgi:hypothetical protein